MTDAKLELENATNTLKKHRDALHTSLYRVFHSSREANNIVDSIDAYIDSKIKYREACIKEYLSDALAKMERIENQIDDELRKLL